MRLDLHTHYYPPAYFDRIERSGGDFSFGTSPTGQRIIRFKGARFFGVTAPMTDVAKRIEDMDRVGIDTEVLSLSTPNVYFVEGKAQADVARLANDAYADLAARHRGRFLGFASIPMDDPDAALRELERALDELGMQGVIVLSNIRGRALADAVYRPFFRGGRPAEGLRVRPSDDPGGCRCVHRVCAGANRGLSVRHDGRDREALLRGRVQVASEHPLARRARRRRGPLSHGAPGRRLAGLRRVPRQHR